MKIRVFAILVAAALSSSAYAAPKEIYVGDNRFACSGSRQECAATDRKNEEREERRRQEQSQRQQLDELRKQTEILREMRDSQERNTGRW